MIVDGKAIADDILADVAQSVADLKVAPLLTIITCTPDLPTQKYLALKKRRAVEVGVRVSVVELIEGCSTEDVVKTVGVAAQQADGVIVQLPLPEYVDTDKVLAALPTTCDVDAVHYDGESKVLPPVVGAVAEIAARHQIDFKNKNVAIVGAGRLVGAPAALWAFGQGAQITILTHSTTQEESTAALTAADIIISGAGVPGLITADKVKSGVAVFDAGTSEDGGALVGDADRTVADVSSVFTPVPGGIGPITVAYLLKNLVTLTSGRQ